MKTVKRRQNWEICPVCQKSVAGDLYPEHGGTVEYLNKRTLETARYHVDCYRAFCDGIVKVKKL